MPAASLGAIEVALRRVRPEETRAVLATANAAAAGCCPDTISRHCIVAHLLPDGSGEAQVFGDLVQEFISTLIVNGENFGAAVPAAIEDAGRTAPHRLVGVTWNSSRDRSATAMLGAFREVPSA